MGFGESVVSSIAQIVDFFILTRSRVVVFYVTETLLNSKNRVERLGLKVVAPVPLCFDTEYLPTLLND